MFDPNRRMTIGSLFPTATMDGMDRKAPGWFQGYDVADFPGLTAEMFLGRGKNKMNRRDIMAMYQPTTAQTPTPATPASPTVQRSNSYGMNAFGAQMNPVTFGNMLGRQPAL